MSSSRPRVWTTQLFADFWKEPDVDYVPSIITDDVVGIWPGEQTVVGAGAYLEVLRDLPTSLPDLRLKVDEHAMSGDFGFSRWRMHATGAAGPFTVVGMDRTRVRDALVCENYIFFDTALFARLTIGDRAGHDPAGAARPGRRPRGGASPGLAARRPPPTGPLKTVVIHSAGRCRRRDCGSSAAPTSAVGSSAGAGGPGSAGSRSSSAMSSRSPVRSTC
jgi:hypothetical protein